MGTSPEFIPPAAENVTSNFKSDITSDVPDQPDSRIGLLIVVILTVVFFNETPNAKGRPIFFPERASNVRVEHKNDVPITLAKRNPENAYDKIIMEAANRHEVHPALIKAIIKAESSYNPKAVSRKGARGLMQLMPQTAREMGVKNSFNPRHNIHGGTKYFKYLLDEFEGNIRLALAAYNTGMNRVKKYGRVPPYKATRSYIRKVIYYYREYRTEMRLMARG